MSTSNVELPSNGGSLHAVVRELPPVFRIVSNGENYRVQVRHTPTGEWQWVYDLVLYEMGGSRAIAEYSSMRRATRRMHKEVASALAYWRTQTEQWVPVAP